jgi:hypothetical protein
MQLNRKTAQPGIQATRPTHSLPVARPIGSSSIIKQPYYCTHPQQLQHRRRHLAVVGSSSDDILKKYGITPAGDISGNSSSSSNKPVPLPKPQTSGESVCTCMRMHTGTLLQQCLHACIPPQWTKLPSTALTMHALAAASM